MLEVVSVSYVSLVHSCFPLWPSVLVMHTDCGKASRSLLFSLSLEVVDSSQI